MSGRPARRRGPAAPAGLILFLLALALRPAHAGSNCEAGPMAPAQVLKAMDLAQRSAQALDASGAQVALIARAGQDLSSYGLRYSHMAYAWRDAPQGRWSVVHELNACGTASSALFVEGLGNFFLDDMFVYESEIVVPGAAAQAALVRLLASDTPGRLHAPAYNMVAYAFSTRYQNSNQWVLETYAAASAAPGAVETREEAQAWLRGAPYRPITVDIPLLTRLGARLTKANIAFDDHPMDRRMAGRIDTVTVDSVVRFIVERDAAAQTLVLK